MLLRPRPGLLPAVAFGCLWASTAAAEEGEIQLTASPAYGLTYTDRQAASGGGGTLSLSYGLSDTVALLATAGASAHPFRSPEPPTMTGILTSFFASAGAAYVLDVVRIVPFFEATVGLLGAARPGATSFHLGLSVGFGGDYLISRRVSVGIHARYFASLTDPGSLPAYLLVMPRFSLRFGL
jgi:hypothetical protein